MNGNSNAAKADTWFLSAVLPAALLCAVTFGAQAQASAPETRANAFNDPFFQISHAIPGCPFPLGPFVTEAERRGQAHHRAERGTSCWLAGQCDKPNFYAYDTGIARELQAALAAEHRFRNSTLWVTVQGRVVYIEGCVPAGQAASLGRQIEAFVRTIPYVQQAIASVYSEPRGKPPYRALTTPRESSP
jgi:hypothetical protein